MKIAIIGWGSLIWSPGCLQIESAWHRDGPMLPVEFARISKDGRLTLVIHPESSVQRTLWATAVSKEIETVREHLREREGTSLRFIHSATADGQFSGGTVQEVRESITAWLQTHRDILGCVWTGLDSNWREKQKSDFSVLGAIQYLRNLPEPDRAREYIENAPSQIQTAVRVSIREQLHWRDSALQKRPI